VCRPTTSSPSAHTAPGNSTDILQYPPDLINGFLATTGLDLALEQPRQLKIFG
jgi:hypothetical protein